MESVSISDEQLRARRVEVALSSPLPPLSIPIKKEDFLSLSSIATIQFHPLAGPNRVLCRIEGVADTDTRQLDKEIASDSQEIDRLDREKLEALRKQAAASKSRDTWGVLVNVTQYLASGASMILAMSCYANGAVGAAIFLFLSGGVGMTTRVLEDMGAWKAVAAWLAKTEERQKKIESQIEMAMFFLSFSLALGGAFWARSAGALALAAAAEPAAWLNGAARAVGLAGNIGGTAARFGQALFEKNISYLQAMMQVASAKISHLYQEMYEQFRLVQTFVEWVGEAGEAVKRMNRMIVVHFDE